MPAQEHQHQQHHNKQHLRHSLDHLDLHTTTITKDILAHPSSNLNPSSITLHHQRHFSDCTSTKRQPLSCFDPIPRNQKDKNDENQFLKQHQSTCLQKTQPSHDIERSNSFNRFLESKQEAPTSVVKRQNSIKRNEYLKTPLQPVEAPGRKDIPMTHLNLPSRDHQVNQCPKHSPMLPAKDYKPSDTSGTKLLSQIIPPPIEYSPRAKCKHDLIQFDTFKLPSPPLEDPGSLHTKKLHKKLSYEMETPFLVSSLDEEEPKLVRKPSRKQQQQQQTEDGKEVRNISLLKVGDLPVPPPPQYSPRSSIRKKEFDHSSICGLPVPPPPQLASPKGKHIHWTDTIATHSIVRPIKSVETPQTYENKIPLQPKGSLSPTRLEKFLSQAVSVQSTLGPIRIPKSSLIGLVHPEQKCPTLIETPKSLDMNKNVGSPIRTRRYSVHSSGILETLGVKTTQQDHSNVTLSPMRYKQSSDMKIIQTETSKKPLSRDASTDSQDLIYSEENTKTYKDKKVLSRDASTDSEDLIQFDDPTASPVKPPRNIDSKQLETDVCKLIKSRQNSIEIVEPKSPKTTRILRDPLLKSFSVDEASRLAPFLTPSLFAEVDQSLQYNIAAMVSPSKQLQTNLRPGNGNSYQFLAPRRSWQDIGVHKPSQPNLDILLASEEAALSPIWLPKQPLEPIRSPKLKKQQKDSAKILTKKDSLGPSISFTRSKRAGHDNEETSSIVIVTKKDVLSPSNSFNRSKKAEELLSKDCLSHFNSFVKSRKSSQDIISPVSQRKKSPCSSLNTSRRPSQEISSPKSPRKKLSPSVSFDKIRRPSQELIIINSEPQKNRLSPSNSLRIKKSEEKLLNSPKSPRKKRLSSSNSQELIIISSPSSPTKKTSSRRSSVSSPKSPRNKNLTPSQSFDKRLPSQELIYISSESPPRDKIKLSPSKSSQDLGSSSSSSPKTVRKKKLSPSKSFDLSRRSSRELIIISSPILTPNTKRSPSNSRRSSQQDLSVSPKLGSRRNSQELTSLISPRPPRKKTSKECLSPAGSKRSSKTSTPVVSRKNSLSPSNSLNFPRSSPIPISSPKRNLSRSNSFSTKSKMFSQTLSIEIPSNSPHILSRSSSINESLSPNSIQRQNLLSPALEAALISEITSKLAGIHSPKYAKQSIGINVISSPSYIYSSPQKSLDFPEGTTIYKGLSPQLSSDVPELSTVSSSSSLIQFNNPEGSSITSQLSLEVPDLSSTNLSSRRSSSSYIYANISPQKSIEMTNANDDVIQINNNRETSMQASQNVFDNMSPQKSPKLSPVQCPIHVEIHVRIPKDENIPMKSQGTQIP